MQYKTKEVQVPIEPYPWFDNNFQLRAGVILIAEVALLSFISVAGLLTVVAVRTYKRWKRRREGQVLTQDAPTQPVALLFILAMCMELIQAFAGVMSVRWSWQGATTEGTYCTLQAVLKQIGNDGAALFTMFLAIMTVIPAIWPGALSLGTGRKIVLGMIAFVIIFWLLMIAIPATTIKNYYGSTGPWCWIPTKKNGHVSVKGQYMGILTEYGWFWLTSLICFICYGYIVFRWSREADGPSELKQAVVMAWYPIAYFVEIFPQSVTRILQLNRALKGQHSTPNGWTILTSVLFASSGWVNVLLWVATGRQYGFTASSVRTVSNNEGGRGEAALADGNQIGPKSTSDRLREDYELGRIPRQAAFPSHASGPSNGTVSSFPTSPASTATRRFSLLSTQPPYPTPYSLYNQEPRQ